MQLITIKTYNLPIEAAIHQSKLEAYGIWYYLKDELTIQSHNFYSNAIGGVKLQVRKEDVERAQEILEIKPVLSSDELDDMVSVCPHCESEDIYQTEVQSTIGRFFLLFASVLFPARSARYQCNNCHSIFREPKTIPVSKD